MKITLFYLTILINCALISQAQILVKPAYAETKRPA